jgi:hypothetical protein
MHQSYRIGPPKHLLGPPCSIQSRRQWDTEYTYLVARFQYIDARDPETTMLSGDAILGAARSLRPPEKPNFTCSWRS